MTCQQNRKMRKRLAVFLILALIAGILPAGKGVPVSGAGGRGLKNPRKDSDGVVTWDCVYFGNYWQSDTNGDGEADKKDAKQPVKWRVLSVDGDDAFLVTDQNIDVQSYNSETADVTWETCTMRSWLNGYGREANAEGEDYTKDSFIGNAFSPLQYSAIYTTKVVNEDNPDFGTEGGNNTLDKVFLLAFGFPSSGEDTVVRESKNTEYVSDGGEIRDSEEEDEEGESAGLSDPWWLRSPGGSSEYPISVGIGGDVDKYGQATSGNSFTMVRPALHLKLSSDSAWSYAGTVSSDGKTTGEATPRPASEEAGSGLDNPRTDSDGVTTWDCVYFGNYWQSDTNSDGKADEKDARQSVKWRVLSVDGDHVFLVTDQNIDVQKYNSKDTTDSFVNNAFTSAERSAIMTAKVADEEDAVNNFSLSSTDNAAAGESKNTEYANTKVQEAWTSVSGDCKKNAVWWLQSPDNYSYFVPFVDLIAFVYQFGSYVSDHYVTVRPALHLNLSSVSGWSHAGTVSSDGKVAEQDA